MTDSAPAADRTEPVGPVSNPPAAATGSPEPAALIEADLTAGQDSRLARYTRRATWVVRVLAALSCVTGLAAFLVALVAWDPSGAGLILVGLVTLPAVALPLYVVRRTGAVARAAAHPREMATQARDLVSRVTQSSDLKNLAGALGDRGDNRSGSKLGVRRAFALARSASSLIGQAQPDDDHHPLLVPFTPERLGRTWAAAVWSLWAWAIALLVLVISIPLFVINLF